MLVLGVVAIVGVIGSARAHRKTRSDDDKPADPDTGQSTIEETTLGVLPIRLRTAA